MPKKSPNVGVVCGMKPATKLCAKTSGLGGTKRVESLSSNLFKSGCCNYPVLIILPPLNGCPGIIRGCA